MVTRLEVQGSLSQAPKKMWGKEIYVRSVDNGKTNYGKSHSRLAGGQHNNQLSDFGCCFLGIINVVGFFSVLAIIGAFGFFDILNVLSFFGFLKIFS